MNHSDDETNDAAVSATAGSESDAAEAALVEAVLPLLPVLGRGLLAGLARRGQAWGLSPAQTKTVLHLAADGPLAVGDVAGRLGVSMPAASEMVDRLVEAGLARREPDRADRRRVLVAATPAAARIGADLADLRRAQVARAFARLAPAERPVLARAIAALAAAMDEVDADTGDGSGLGPPGCATGFPPEGVGGDPATRAPAAPGPDFGNGNGNGNGNDPDATKGDDGR